MNLRLFNTATLFEAATDLFRQLNIKLNSNTRESLPLREILKQYYKDNDTFKAINNIFFIGIIDDSIFRATGLFDINYSYKEAIEQGDKNYNGLMLFALELKRHPTRTQISELTRAFNRISQKMPVALLLSYQNTHAGSKTKDIIDVDRYISLAISERFKYLQNWRQGERTGKVIILRDIHTINTHAGHVRILNDLVKPVGATNYEQLHKHWLGVLDVSILNKKFYHELSNWYFTAMNKVSFPDDKEQKIEIRNANNLIRLITRIIFIWFLKEKHLVPAHLFHKDFLTGILKDFNKNQRSRNYYNAILQNLFFATLNQKMEERKFAKDDGYFANKEEFGVKNLYRYSELFTISQKEVMNVFKDVPFLNGGLFDCLDKPDDEGKIEYVDGFSRNPKKQSSIPDYLFFGEEKEVDLNEIYGTKNKRYATKGLINILESYKFTIAENTPIEEEIALDPELLGKVFENLLASYNPETQTTARKQTGSFYTPREIVNYMVDESLIEYLKQYCLAEPGEKIVLGSQQTELFGNAARKGQLKLESSTRPSRWKNRESQLDEQLHRLLSYEENQPFTDNDDIKELIEAIHKVKILDPACGSGAFPMGALHKMVHILQKLDPGNKHWRELQRRKAISETEATFKLGDKELRAQRLAEINDVFENNASDYGRKLYLIENCIYGIDIQPIAVQIAKLRFFISLVIDQKAESSSLMNNNKGVRPLPNLETKFVAANTLIGLEKPASNKKGKVGLGLLENIEIEKKKDELKNLRHKYFTANTRKEKLALQKKDKTLRSEIAKLLENDGWETRVAEQIVAFDPYDQNQSAGWFDKEWMFGMKSGFDIVIGNPPYVRQERIGKEYKLILRNKFPVIANGIADLYVYFFGIGLELLKSKGVLIYITLNKYLKTKYGLELRNFLADKYDIDVIIDFFELPVFEASTDTSITKIIATNSNKETKYFPVRTLENLNLFELTSGDFQKVIKDYTEWKFVDNRQESILYKISLDAVSLKTFSNDKIFRGVTTGANHIFIIDELTKERIINSDPQSKKYIHSYVEPTKISQWVTPDTKKYIIGTFPSLGLDINKLTGLKEYLKDFKKILEPKPRGYTSGNWGGRKPGSYKWFEIQDNIAYYRFFELPKIIYIHTAVNHQFYYDIEGRYINNSCYMIISDSQFLFCFLNSRLFDWFKKIKFVAYGDAEGRGRAKLDYNKMITVPIKKVSKSNENMFSKLIDEIRTKKSKHQDTITIEHQINRLIYELYDLTEDEIKIIEGNE